MLRVGRRAYLSGLDYGLSYPHLAGLTDFFRRLVAIGRVPGGTRLERRGQIS